MAPLLPTNGLEALTKALADDDPRLLQGATATPPPLQCMQEWDVEAACGVGFCGWQGHGLKTVAEVERFFADVCFQVDQRMGEPAACRWFLNWFDETPREEMRRELLAEASRTLAERLRGEDQAPANVGDVEEDDRMLVLSRNRGEEIVLTLEDGRRITVALIEIRTHSKAMIGISCDRSIKINRAEIQAELDAQSPPHGPGVG